MAFCKYHSISTESKKYNRLYRNRGLPTSYKWAANALNEPSPLAAVNQAMLWQLLRLLTQRQQGITNVSGITPFSLDNHIFYIIFQKPGRSISNRGPTQTQNRFIFGQAGNAGIAGAALGAATQYFANQVLNPCPRSNNRGVRLLSFFQLPQLTSNCQNWIQTATTYKVLH